MRQTTSGSLVGASAGQSAAKEFFSRRGLASASSSAPHASNTGSASGTEGGAGVDVPDVIKELLAKPVVAYDESGASITGQPLTNVAFILDESGSMGIAVEEIIAGFNQQSEVVREGAKEAGETKFTNTNFSSEVRVRGVAQSLQTLKPLSKETYSPNGGTALLDAVGLTIARILETERVWGARTATLVTVFTDGEENSSNLFSEGMLADVIARLQMTGRWTFALVGPQGNIHAFAKRLGVPEGNVAAFDVSNSAGYTAAFDRAAMANTSYMQLRAVGAMRADSLYAPEDGEEN